MGSAWQPRLREGRRDELDLARRRGRAVREGHVRPAHAEAHRALRAQTLVGDTGHRWIVRRERLPHQGGLVLGEVRVGQAHGAREQLHHLPVGARLALRLDHRVGELHVEVAERLVEIGVLHGGGGGEHEVGVVRGVGEVLLVDHREEILAREARRSTSSWLGTIEAGFEL